MSKRFGRNQRRRMREQVAGLARTVEMDRGLLREQSSTLSMLREEIARAKRIVGANSVLFEPERLELLGPERDRIESYIHEPFDYSCLSGNAPPATATVRTIPLDVMLVRMEDDTLMRDRFYTMQHIRVQFAGNRWGYALSQQAIHTVPTKDLARMLSRELGEMIARELKGSAHG